MDFQSAMETFAEAWVAANTKGGSLSEVGCTQNQAIALTRNCKTPTSPPSSVVRSPPTSTTPQQDTALLSSSKDPYDIAKSSSGKLLPVHCVVESVSILEETKLSWKNKPTVETDSYVIVPVNTAFQELVQVALHRLGYPRDSASAAKGSVIIKNWKPLSFDKIAESPQVTVGDILGELTTVATVRIQLYKARPSVLSDIKDKLLRLFLVQYHGILVSTGCPLDEAILSYLCRGPPSPGSHPAVPEPTDECRRKFEQWWNVQVSQQQQHQQQQQQTPSHPQHVARPQSASQYSTAHHNSPSKLLERQHPLSDNVHPALQTVQSQYPTQKTRMRTSFDPELELPKLQRWFAENQHPSRQQIQHYVKELNGLESRRGRKPLDINNVVYWFKNARAAQKRAELRGVTPGLSCHLSLNGYNSNSHSPPNSSSGLILGQESLVPDSRLLSHSMKSPCSPGHSPSRGQLFLSDQHSENSDDGVHTSDREEEEDHILDVRIERRDEIRGDPREDLRNSMDMDGGRDTESPVAPLSLTINNKDAASSLTNTAMDCSKKEANEQESRNEQKTIPEVRNDLDERQDCSSPDAPLSLTMNDKDLSKSPYQDKFMEVASIKAEPTEEITSHLSGNNNIITTPKQELEDMSDDEDEEDDDADDTEDRSKDHLDNDEEIGTMHPARIADLNRQQQERIRSFRSPSPSDAIIARGPPTSQPNFDRLTAAAAAGFPLVPNSMFSHSIMYMSHYIPGLTQQHPVHHHGMAPGTPPSSSSSSSSSLNLSALAASADERRKRNRTFIDPVTEVPRLEQWFSLNTHPSHNLILKYTEELNRMPYRQKFPRLEPKNVQFWFKNRRAKCKRLKMSLFESTPPGLPQNHHPIPYHHQSPNGDQLRNRD